MNETFLEGLREELGALLAKRAPRYKADNDCRAAKICRAFALGRERPTFAKLVACALVDSCLGCNVPALKQVLALLDGAQGEDGGAGILAALMDGIDEGGA